MGCLLERVLTRAAASSLLPYIHQIRSVVRRFCRLLLTSALGLLAIRPSERSRTL